ncbi:hypothetical protein IEQ34_009961 [Dendrobium chrysotoxum]|uniref:Uncharacterized protein n=1 Tax=Dendrobium chrysotoxum TaxID=161865 RepID=A0AAV7H065_DENCH|nr:hypothetical protein IEQ34_009961 [Dendrobium chrysotoxum]
MTLLSLMESSSDIWPPLQPHVGGGATVEEEDAFLGFVAYARSMLFPDEGMLEDRGCAEVFHGPSWSWLVSRIFKTCIAYPSGVTSGILLSDLFQAWCEQRRFLTSKKNMEWMIPLKRRRRRRRLPNTVTIDSIFEKNFLSPTSCLEAVPQNPYFFLSLTYTLHTFSISNRECKHVENAKQLTKICTCHMTRHKHIHAQFGGPLELLYYHLVESDSGILKKGREILLTGCSLRPAMEGSGHHRLLPTEYLVILLDEDQDEDAMLLGARFCTDSFSCISHDTVKDDAAFSLFARQSIGSLEVQGALGSLQRKQIILIDNDGVKINFLLWGEQVILANLFSIGCMLALDTPFIASAPANGGMSEEICLEYGSITQLYLVPFVQHEEQVHLSSTQARYQGSKSSCTQNQSQSKGSQVILPLNPQGSIDFSSYPFRIQQDQLLQSCTLSDHVSWFEKDSESTFVNLSSLPALLNSSCLHRLSCLSDIHKRINSTNICSVHLSLIELHHIRPVLSHTVCGHPVCETCDGVVQCSFCHLTCEGELMRCFHLEITVADGSSSVFTWSTGQTASELLQISPDEFYELPEDEQAMYLYTLKNERFMIAIVHSLQKPDRCFVSSIKEDYPIWEITRAQKCD